MSQVIQHPCKQHLVQPHVDSISLSEIGARRSLEGSGLKGFAENALRSGLHNPVILPQVVVVYERCILLDRRGVVEGAWVEWLEANLVSFFVAGADVVAIDVDTSKIFVIVVVV